MDFEFSRLDCDGREGRRSAAAIIAICALFAAGCVGRAEADGPRFVRENSWAGKGVWLKADTHTHTEFSDGAHSVAEVAARAAEYGCDVLAITDHADRELGAGTHEYIEAIKAARREHPNMVILAGLEWNVPPYGGDEHVVVLFPPGRGEGQNMAEFKARYDDLGREDHDAALADEGLEWLAALGFAEGIAPVAIYEHPSRKRKFANQIVGDLRRWRAVNDVMVGFSGAPGHQGMEPTGSYKSHLSTVSRWDPAAAKVGDAWDKLLQKGIDVWGALAPSDFHDARREGLGDYWPGQFSETWVYAPDKSAEGVLKALRAGSFFGAHGGIVREVELLVEADGLSRPARAGECIEVPEGVQVRAQLHFKLPATMWDGRTNRIDTVDLISVTADGATVETIGHVPSDGAAFTKTIDVAEGGLALRARGRHGDLMFYTNPVRVRAIEPSELLATSGKAMPVWGKVIGRWAGWIGGAAAVLIALIVMGGWLRRGGGVSLPVVADPGNATSATGRLHAETAQDLSPPVRRELADTSATFPTRSHYSKFFLGFVAFAVYGSLVPLNFQPLPLAEAWTRFRDIPFLHLSIASRADWVANIVLFVPIGYCGLAALTCDRASKRRAGLLATLVIAGCVSLSVALEFTQVWFPPRTVSQNDIVAESLGSIFGVLLWLGVGGMSTAWLRSFTESRGPRERLDWLLQAYLVGICLYSLFPLDVTIAPGELWQKYKEGKLQAVPFAGFRMNGAGLFEAASAIILFLPIGMFAATALLPPRHRPRSFGQSWLIGMGIATAIELAQVFVYSRFSDTTHLIYAAIGVAVGASWRRRQATRSGQNRPLSAFSRPCQAAMWLGAAVGYSALLAVFFLLPFQTITDPNVINERWQGFFGVPLTTLYWGSEFNAVTQVLRKGLLFAPLGVATVRLADLIGSSKCAHVMVSFGSTISIFVLAFGIEFGQIWRDTTTANFTDVMLCTFGALAGMFVTRKLAGPVTSISTNSAMSAAKPSLAPALRIWRPTAALTLTLAVLASVTIAAATAWWAPKRSAIANPDAGPNLGFAPKPFFNRLPADPRQAPTLSRIALPWFDGAAAVWGATGRDSHGHVWLGVSAHGSSEPSARLFEYIPHKGILHDRGDVVSQLKALGIWRPDESQSKIHSKIVEAADGFLYFSSMDEQGEREDGGRLPDWGSHLWRLRPGIRHWQHLLAVPEGLIAVATGHRYVYALGYFDHVLYQHGLEHGGTRSLHVGSIGGHISRNFVCDARDHAYVPRLRSVGDASQVAVSLVEFDNQLNEIGETPLEHYLPPDDLLSHGITGVQPLADGTIVFLTHVGFLYQILPSMTGAAEVRPLGWFHPRGQAYVASLFTYSGDRCVVGVSAAPPCEWLTFDLNLRASTAVPLSSATLLRSELLYGCATRDDLGNFYLVGTHSPSGTDQLEPFVVKAVPPP